MLFKRILSLVLGFAFTIFVVLMTNPIVINLLITGFAFIAIHEMEKAFRKKDIKIISIASYVFAILTCVMNILVKYAIIDATIETIFYFFTLPISIITLLTVYVFKHHKYTIQDVAFTILQLIYTVILFNYIVYTYQLSSGYLYIWYIFIGSWFTDIFAFIVGKLIGKHKFTSISPNKTIEGSIGGIFGAIIGFLIYTFVINTYLGTDINYVYISILAIVASFVSQIGDLFASSIKRYTNIKDFGNVFPGHGGMLDRFDSTLFVAPLIYIFFFFIV